MRSLTSRKNGTRPISDATILEGGNLVFTVSLSNPVDVATTLDVSFTDVTTAAGDFNHTTQQVTFAALDTVNKTVTVATTGDNIVEADETFSLNLSNVVGATLADGSATGTIR